MKIEHEKTWIWLRQRNHKRETESVLIVAQNNAIRVKYSKAKIHSSQRNSKCRLYGEREGTVNHIISECCKLAQKKKIRHDWMGKVTHGELCKILKFDHTDKWYMHKSEPVREHETHKIL